MKFYKTLIFATLLLSSARAFASLPDATKAWLDKNSKTITKLYVSGGTSSVDDATVAAADTAKDKASSVKLESFTGTIKVKKKDGTTVEYTNNGNASAPVLNDGDEVTVVSGEAKLTSGGTSATLKAGDGVSVTGRSMTVTAGTVTFTNSKGSTTATAGQTVTAPAPASVSSSNNNTSSNNPTSNDSTNTTGNPQQEQQTSVSPSAP